MSSVFNILETNLFNNNQIDQSQNLLNLSLFNNNNIYNNSHSYFYPEEFKNCNSNEKNNFLNSLNDKKNIFDDLELENLNSTLLTKLGLEEENINLIKYIAKDIKFLMGILENNEFEKFYEFIISSQSLNFQRAVNLADERFIDKIL